MDPDFLAAISGKDDVIEVDPDQLAKLSSTLDTVLYTNFVARLNSGST